MIEVLTSALDHWTAAEFFDAFVARISTTMGFAPFMALVATSIFTSLYWWSKSFVVPTVVLVLLGGVFVAMLPAVFARAAWLIILLGGGFALFALFWAVLR